MESRGLALLMTYIACVSLATAAPRVLALATHDVTTVKPVNVTLYYESLCPDCQEFIMGQLGPAWSKVKDTNLMTVDLLPYGNSREKQTETEWAFECQHGVKECWGNLLETCVIHHYPNTTQHLNIIQCIEEDFVITMGYDWKDTLRKCSDGVDVAKITACTQGKEGNALEHQVALRTGPHDYVPWILIDGKQDAGALNNLLASVCKAYKGTPPKECHKYDVL